tara:strand:- start:1173 stop:1298 length:126 start_codon:yes stop_codon:yes gene_type:complete
MKYKLNMEYSNCCGASSAWLNDGLCGECLEHAEFYLETEDQ